MKYIAKFAIIAATLALASCAGTTISGPFGTATKGADGSLTIQPNGTPIVLPGPGNPVIIPAAPVATPAPLPAQ